MEFNTTDDVLEELLNIEVELQDVQGKVSLPPILYFNLFLRVYT